MNLNLRTAFKFCLLIIISIVTIYYSPGIFSTLYLLLLLVLYWKSNDEPFWFALFFVLSDGFMGFFGPYQATISTIPGLPPIEVAQFYILMSVMKVWNRTRTYPVFYNKHLYALGIYVVILIFLGFAIGVNNSPNDYFRIVKLTFPLLLFYSIPKLFISEKDYFLTFSLIFPIAILAFIAQMFDILVGQSLAGILGAKSKAVFDVMEGQIYRGFYNVNIVLVSLFGALFFSLKRNQPFKLVYLNLIILSTIAMAFMSATRGWMLAFGFISIFYALILIQVKTTRLLFFLIFSLAVIIFAASNPYIQKQATRSIDRFSTIESIAEGDLTAGGTATRATDQSQRVIDKWKESPIFGWGFSEEFRNYVNEHVGNQSILLHSGLTGALLLLSFFILFQSKLLTAAIRRKRKEFFIFSIFFIGWFLIHSTSGQHFAYYQMPKNIMAQSLYFSFGAFVYSKSILYG